MAAHSEWPTDSQIFLLPMFVLVPLAYIHKQIEKIVQQMSNVCLQNANGEKKIKKNFTIDSLSSQLRSWEYWDAIIMMTRWKQKNKILECRTCIYDNAMHGEFHRIIPFNHLSYIVDFIRQTLHIIIWMGFDFASTLEFTALDGTRKK